jgi:glycerate dehydrogenase
MRAVILDIDSLGDDINLDGLRASVPCLTEYGATSHNQVSERVRGHDIVITNKTPISAQTFHDCPELRFIAVTATGLNNIDLPAALAAGVPVANVTHYATGSLVQHTFALMLALATRLPAYDTDVRRGLWHQSPNFCLMHHPIMELEGKTLGIVGYGDLGQAVARAAGAFGMRVLVARRPGQSENPWPFSGPEADNQAPVTASGHPPPRVAFDTLLEQADVVSLHCLLSDQTHHLMGAPQFVRMKRSALLINTARGGLIDEQALGDALRAGQIAGAGLDVVSVEPPVPGNPLLEASLPNLIITPHCAWASLEARQRLIDKTADNLREFVASAQPD